MLPFQHEQDSVPDQQRPSTQLSILARRHEQHQQRQQSQPDLQQNQQVAPLVEASQSRSQQASQSRRLQHPRSQSPQHSPLLRQMRSPLRSSNSLQLQPRSRRAPSLHSQSQAARVVPSFGSAQVVTCAPAPRQQSPLPVVRAVRLASSQSTGQLSSSHLIGRQQSQQQLQQQPPQQQQQNQRQPLQLRLQGGRTGISSFGSAAICSSGSLSSSTGAAAIASGATGGTAHLPRSATRQESPMASSAVPPLSAREMVLAPGGFRSRVGSQSTAGTGPGPIVRACLQQQQQQQHQPESQAPLPQPSPQQSQHQQLAMGGIASSMTVGSSGAATAGNSCQSTAPTGLAFSPNFIGRV